ncbi:hypothetical protein GCM10027089_38950 [Nocardia thraciensis]
MLCDSPSTAPYGGGSDSPGQWTIDFTASGQMTVTPPAASTYSPTPSGCVLLCDTASRPSTTSPGQGSGQAPFGVTTPSR